MKTNKILGLVFLFLLVMPLSAAIGLAPASKQSLLDNADIVYELRIMNEQQDEGEFEIQVTGDLQEHIRLSKNKIVFDKEKKFENIQVILTKPSQKLEGGEYITRIIVQKNNVEQNQMIAQIGVASKLIITVPYEGVALDAELFVPNFIKNTENQFSVNVLNNGIKDATNCKAIVEVFTPLNAKIYSKTTESMSIVKKTKERITIPWTPNVENGNYLAKATVICDEMQVSKETPFSVGSPEILIDDVIADKFKLGQISKLDLVLSNAWGEVIKDVFAEVELMKDDKVLAQSKTESKNIQGLGKEILPAYLDMTSIEPGKYMLVITVKYLGKELSEVYEAMITQDKMTLSSLTGKVSGGSQGDISAEGTGGINSLLIIILVFVVGINGFLAYRLIKKKKT